MAESVFQGTFASVRPVAGRKVWQFVIEVPQEQANAALAAMGGLPSPDESRWVAVARLKPQSPQETQAERATARKPESKRWQDMKLSARAGIMCGEPEFWAWARHHGRLVHHADLVVNADTAAIWLRHRTAVDSRKEYDTNEAAGRRYLEIERAFYATKDPRP